ncbi:hypothetical protein RvY_14029 [Ramazzottius varieornatus]|uniref:Palmitoyltransferase n=1 Tax=Ramazzottius varieornatus TaxID=947166 RepID=A0A1D1VTT7_RAMVA|nr:hypothetical protein RvY_14029 [Ramazzottius varieornatus]
MFENPCVRCIIAVAKWFPVIFISAVVGWSYYAYVVELCILEVKSGVERGFYLFFFHIFFILFVWSYWQTIFTNSDVVPLKFKLSPQQVSQLDSTTTSKDYESGKRLLDAFGKDLPVATRGFNGDLRYCDKCKIIKPDRCHHCSVCERCILKMDHHCPWVNNCVCFNNYKFFILFLGYAMAYCLYISLTDLQYFIKFWQDKLSGDGGGKFHILFLFFVSTMFAVSVLTLLSYHCYLVFSNQSTLESHRPPVFTGGPDKNGFNLGRYQNFREIFGDKPALWFIPIFTSKGDGMEFPATSVRNLLKADRNGHNGRVNESFTRSHGSGLSFPVRTVDDDRDDLLQRPFNWNQVPAFPAMPSVRVENEQNLI